MPDEDERHGSPESYRILHLSDPHLTATGRDGDGVDAVSSLRRILDDCRHVEGIDAVVVSGDIADDGSEDGCASARDLVGEFAAARDAPHLYCVGNHDDRATFSAALGSGHLSAAKADVAILRGPAGTCSAVSHIRGLRIVTLDSLLPGQTPGRLDEDQLHWLADLLATPAVDGTVLVLHHPPISVPRHPMEHAVLQNPDDLAAVVAGRDVRIMLTGHLHLQMSGTLGGVPVWVAPGVVTRIDLSAPPSVVRGVLGAGASIVDLGGPSSPTCHVLTARDPRAGEQVYAYDALTGEDVPTDPGTQKCGGSDEAG